MSETRCDKEGHNDAASRVFLWASQSLDRVTERDVFLLAQLDYLKVEIRLIVVLRYLSYLRGGLVGPGLCSLGSGF